MSPRGGTGARSRHGGGRRAFSILELLVTIGIIALLTMLLLGVVMHARHHARDTRCKGNLSQLWKAVNYYANANNDLLFVNNASPLQISNVIYKNQAPSGWGHLYPRYLKEHRLFYCPADPVRSVDWETYGWHQWETEEGEVQCSYGWRGRQGLVADEAVALSLSEVERNPQKVVGCDFYETHTPEWRVHHSKHINVLRCNGGVSQVDAIVGFGPEVEDSQAALDVLDR